MISENQTHQAEYLTDRQVAEWLNISVATVWRHAGNGKLPGRVRIGGCTRFRRSVIQQKLNEQEAA
ncbi:MAG: helix-turn-helix domain-containing protein [Pseudomonadota bacterium]